MGVETMLIENATIEGAIFKIGGSVTSHIKINFYRATNVIRVNASVQCEQMTQTLWEKDVKYT